MKRSDLYRAVARDIAAKAKNDRLIDDDEENSVMIISLIMIL